MTAEEQAGRRSELYAELCRGWYIGTREGKKALLEDFEEGRLRPEVHRKAVGHGPEQGERLLEEGLRRLGRSGKDLETDLKLAPWKVVLAGWIKVQCGVSNGWLSESMHVGSIYSISEAVSEQLRTRGQGGKLWRAFGTPTSKG
jgi:hypothetical protein